MNRREFLEVGAVLTAAGAAAYFGAQALLLNIRKPGLPSPASGHELVEYLNSLGRKHDKLHVYIGSDALEMLRPRYQISSDRGMWEKAAKTRRYFCVAQYPNRYLPHPELVGQWILIRPVIVDDGTAAALINPAWMAAEYESLYVVGDDRQWYQCVYRRENYAIVGDFELGLPVDYSVPVPLANFPNAVRLLSK